MLRSTPRIEVNQRSREARLRLERVERLIVVVMTRRSLLVARTSGLAAKLRRVLSRSGSRPNRPSRSRSVSADETLAEPNNSWKLECLSAVGGDRPEGAVARRRSLAEARFDRLYRRAEVQSIPGDPEGFAMALRVEGHITPERNASEPERSHV